MIKRFLTSDADAKELEGLVAEISASIHDDFLVSIPAVVISHHDVLTSTQLEQVLVTNGGFPLGLLLMLLQNIEENVIVIREDVEVVRKNVEVICEDGKVIREGMGGIHEDLKAVREQYWHSSLIYRANDSRRCEYALTVSTPSRHQMEC